MLGFPGWKLILSLRNVLLVYSHEEMSAGLKGSHNKLVVGVSRRQATQRINLSTPNRTSAAVRKAIVGLPGPKSASAGAEHPWRLENRRLPIVELSARLKIVTGVVAKGKVLLVLSLGVMAMLLAMLIAMLMAMLVPMLMLLMAMSVLLLVKTTMVLGLLMMMLLVPPADAPSHHEGPTTAAPVGHLDVAPHPPMVWGRNSNAPL